MNRVDHILSAFSMEQIRFLSSIFRDRKNDLNNLEPLTEDEEYVGELLEKAENFREDRLS
jgi:hypothetical protein